MSRIRPPARWRTAPAVPADIVRALSDSLAPRGEHAHKSPLPESLLALLAVRGVHDPEVAKGFLRPSLGDLTPPEALGDLRRAAERIATSIRAGERIVVHGDYDVDGICSTALLTRVLRGVGGDVVPFIPDRKTDGYDLGPAGVRAAVEAGAKLVVTCDCGTTAVEPARALEAAGIALIITDHHQPGAELPPCVALVNPQRDLTRLAEGTSGRGVTVGSNGAAMSSASATTSTRADQHLAAVGVAWKLASVVSELCGGDPQVVDDQLELVALATVADVAPLTGDNRILVAEGLKRMTTPRSPTQPAPRNLGLRALLRSAGLDEKRLTAGRLGFVVAPRLNALGRIRQALLGVDLLLAEDETTAMDLAAKCNEANAERQELDRRILEEAQRRLDDIDLDAARGLVLAGDGWEPGVIGIVASRVVELTHRPTFMIAVAEDGGQRIGKGSGRSVSGFDLHAALVACGDLLIKYGGHRAAAGLTIDAARIDEFTERFDAEARSRLSDEQLVPELRPDLELPIGSANERLLAAIRYLEPFGVGNPGPVLVSRGVSVVGGPRKVGSDGLKLQLDAGDGPREAVGWGMAARAAEVGRDARLDLVYRLDVNEYRGARTLQATILDLRKSDA
ncbi:MAG: DHH family phosphoesterase [Gemmatimonadaceae bacterium]|nr:DHH family phosphoesterase [Gemmatimonadaceae bacterium]